MKSLGLIEFGRRIFEVFAFLGWSVAGLGLAPRLEGHFWAERAYEHARRGALALRRAGIKRRGAPETVCSFGLFRSRFVRFGWGFLRDVSRGHFGGLE